MSIFLLLLHLRGQGVLFEPGRAYASEAVCVAKADYLNKLFQADRAFECVKTEAE